MNARLRRQPQATQGMLEQFQKTFSGKRILVTGHTGFKGAWLTAWLSRFGASVVGVALATDQGEHSVFERAGLDQSCDSRLIDIRDADAVHAAFEDTTPQFVFHLAAQALVRRSYRAPLETFSSNVMGTANVLEAARNTPSVHTVVCVTTDKVYDNRESSHAYRENDPLGGIDPYSASKSAAEMVALAYMKTLPAKNGHFKMATARGGNVVGGGDWSEDRIVPDIVRSVHGDNALVIRYPGATRPWQHVMDINYGYLMLAMRLARGFPERNKVGDNFIGAWNFGPDRETEITVAGLVKKLLAVWGAPDYPVEFKASAQHESNYLKLDSSKAGAQLGWVPLLGADDTLDWTMRWYRDYLAAPKQARNLIDAQISDYETRLPNSIADRG